MSSFFLLEWGVQTLCRFDHNRTPRSDSANLEPSKFWCPGGRASLQQPDTVPAVTRPAAQTPAASGASPALAHAVPAVRVCVRLANVGQLAEGPSSPPLVCNFSCIYFVLRPGLCGAHS